MAMVRPKFHLCARLFAFLSRGARDTCRRFTWRTLLLQLLCHALLFKVGTVIFEEGLHPILSSSRLKEMGFLEGRK